MDAGPRLQVGQRPVATTVADVYGNGIPDIVAVNQDSNTVTVLRGLGGGFFDDTNPLTLQTDQAPIQAFVGKFDNKPGLGLVVLNSLSGDMTYYSGFVAGQTAPVNISTGVANPVAGAVVGDGGNGYAGLIVATDDNHLIDYLGSPNGLAAVATAQLSGSGQGAVALSNVDTAGGKLRVFIGEGTGQVFAVTFTSEIAAAPTQAAEGHVAASASETAPETGNFNFAANTAAFLLGSGGTVTGTQAQAAAPAAATSGVSMGVAAAAGLITGIASGVAQPLFSPSLRSYTWLLEKLAQMAQSQVTEILPLSGSDVASVAVILVVSGASDPAGSNLARNQAVTWDDVISQAEVSTAPIRSSSASPLEQFLFNEFSPPTGIAADPDGPLRSQIGFGPEWVWREGTLGSSVIAVTGRPSVDIAKPGAAEARRGPQAGTDGPRQSDGEPATFPSTPAQDVEASSQAEDPTSLTNRVISSVALVLGSVAGFAWKRWKKRVGIDGLDL
jgi:hypothetical protein